VVFDAADGVGCAPFASDRAAEVLMHSRPDVRRDAGIAVLGREHDVVDEFGVAAGHGRQRIEVMAPFRGRKKKRGKMLRTAVHGLPPLRGLARGNSQGPLRGQEL
jgi:hypothetical protein